MTISTFHLSNLVDPTVIIRGDVRMGRDNVIHPFTVLEGPLDIGDHNIIGPFVRIGGPGEDTRNPRYDCSRSSIRIGSHNIIREHCSVAKPCYSEVTSLGDHIYVMQFCQIPHDCTIENHVVVSQQAALGGIVTAMEGAVFALNCSVHQRSVIGAYSIVGQGSAAVKNVKPFSRYIPGKPLSVNEYALKKYGFTEWAAEVEAFVLRDVLPTTPQLRDIVERYLALHQASGRSQY